MLTLTVFAACGLVSCLAAAGLIASAQNSAEYARASGGFDIGQDGNAYAADHQGSSLGHD